MNEYERIEAVAKALVASRYTEKTWDYMREDVRDVYRKQAVAAINAYEEADLREQLEAVEAQFDLAKLRDRIGRLEDEIFHGPADSTDRDNPQGILTRLSRLEESSADPTDEHVTQDQNPSPIERIKVLSIDPDGPLGDKFSYTWDHGHETLYEDSCSYSGTYHPDGLCVGNPCEFCGRTYYDG